MTYHLRLGVLPRSRFAAGAVALLVAAWAALAQPTSAQADDQDASKRPDPQKVYLWPEGAPQAKGEAEADRPMMYVYLPAKDKATGAGIVVCPGGGYGGHAMDHEGVQIANYLNEHGIAAFVLRYRLSPYRHPIPLLDAQRAIRLVRSRAQEYGLDKNRLGIMGFSAGGHLAATVGTHFDNGNPEAADAIDRESCRPNFLVLCYAVISLSEPFHHGGSRRNLLGEKAEDPALIENLSNEKQVTKDTPPTFLFHTDEDTGVPPENSVAFYLALRKAGVPAEMHIYAKGPHGVGLMPGDPVLSTWAKRLVDWLKVSGFLSTAPRAAVKGKVTVDGQPLSYGTIAFIPAEGVGKVTAVARVRNGSYQLPASTGPAIGPAKVVITRMSQSVISEVPTIKAAEQIDANDGKPVEIAAGNNTLDFQLQSP
jgi:acetyl esterase/lipase